MNQQRHIHDSFHGFNNRWRVGDWCWGDAAATAATTTVPIKTQQNSPTEVASSSSALSSSIPTIATSMSNRPEDNNASLPEDRRSKRTPQDPALPVPATATSSNSPKLEPLDGSDDDDAVPDSIVSSSSSSSAGVPSSNSPKLERPDDDDDVSNSIVSSSSSAGAPSSNATSSARREWKVGDWCWLETEAAPVAADTESSSLSRSNRDDDSSPGTKQVCRPHRASEQVRRLPRSCRQAKRKAAGATPAANHADCELLTEYSSDASEAGPPKKKGNYKKFHDNKWEEMFQLLLEYQQEHGDTLVPYNRKGIRTQLGNWVHEQRKLYRKEQLAQSRLLRLNSIGFVWNALSDRWEEMFQLLLQYKKEHGNTQVPLKHRGIRTQLGNWVCQQRCRSRDNKLEKDRIVRLQSIGFVFDGKGNGTENKEE